MAILGEKKAVAPGASPNGNGTSPARQPATRPEPGLLSSLAARLKWFYPGMRVKRWLLVVVLGILVVTFGVDLIFLMQLASLGDELNRWIYRNFNILLAEEGRLQI